MAGVSLAAAPVFQTNTGNNPNVDITISANVGDWVFCIIQGSNTIYPVDGWEFETSPVSAYQSLAVVYRKWQSGDAPSQTIALTSAGLDANSIAIYRFVGAHFTTPLEQIVWGQVAPGGTIPTSQLTPAEGATLAVVAFGSRANSNNASSVGTPYNYDGNVSSTDFGTNSYIASAHLPTSPGTGSPLQATFTPGSGVAFSEPYLTVAFLVRSGFVGNIEELVRGDSQTRLAVLQVFRGGNWIDIPFESIKGTFGKDKAGKLDIAIPETEDDTERSQIYEGEKVRLFRGVLGAPLVRCFTGYCDSREPTDSVAGISRAITATDVVKELNDAILLGGVLYDGLTPTQAAVDLLNRTIESLQYRPTDDEGNYLTSLANANQPNGNQICYFPDLYNDDESLFYLPTGILASYTANSGESYPTIAIPVASAGYNYVEFEFPNRYMVASMTKIDGFTQQTTATTFPPPPKHYVLDAYNGIAYFNVADGSTSASFSASYYDSPLFDFDQGESVGDALSQLFDQAGNKWKPDGNGKLISQNVNTTTVPTGVLNKGNYIDAGVTINRERRNVIVCLGWDGNCGGLLVSKCVLTDDIENPPPYGLGKRAYMIVQDQTWQTQYAVNIAAYYAALQVGRRGKEATITIIDDPTIDLNDALVFESAFPEIGAGDMFYVDQIAYELSISNSQIKATNDVSGTLLAGTGLIYLGPASAASQYGNLDYTQDATPMFEVSLQDHISHETVGGTYYSQFSISRGVDLVYQIGPFDCFESIDVYGSDGSHHVYESNIFPRNANTLYSLPLPIGTHTGDLDPLTPGVLYVFQHYVRDTNGNIAIFRTFGICAP